jgi:hypothetical protein
VEDGWRFGGGSEIPRFLQIVINQNNTKKSMPSGGGWRYKSKNYLRKCSGNAYLLNIIRIFGVEAVWKQPNLPPHLSSISTSKRYKAVFTLSGGWRQNKKIFSKEKNIVYLNFMKGT